MWDKEGLKDAIVTEKAQPEMRPDGVHGTALQRSVAIVDDDPQISQALGQWVELQGLHALYFPCAECLLTALVQGRQPLTIGPTSNEENSSTLVAGILDLNLPGKSGLTLAHWLRSLDADLPLVIVTALREEERRRYGQLPTGVLCLQKPFDLDALENALFPVMH
jgi:DNA-binding response OmpR family regulator